MEKRLNRTDYLFVLLFIFMLVCIAGAFFYGVKYGKQQAENNYEKLNELKTDANETPGSYDQQYLVSFYHTIYSPYREFQNKWFITLNDIENRSKTIDSSAAIRELSKIAKDSLSKLRSRSLPDNSPLLQQSQQNFQKSLKLFDEAMQGYISKANSTPSSELLADIASNAKINEAKQYALQAQKDYYSSMIKWQQSIDAKLQPIEADQPLTLDEWKQQPLSIKNNYVAGSLLSSTDYVPFLPQDMASKVDDLIASGQMHKLGKNTIDQAVTLLIDTDAVRSGDFIKAKHKRYEDETLPQLPFFFEQN